jgi:hypothetical protein
VPNHNRAKKKNAQEWRNHGLMAVRQIALRIVM